MTNKINGTREKVRKKTWEEEESGKAERKS